jgi:hypothetical protein
MPASSQKPLRIVHAPNHRHFKGTGFVIEAVEQLRREGLALELTLVERLSNDEALAIYRTADLVFDQCLIGFHGYFAIEAMALGKPVMCFIRKPSEYLIDHENCPIISAQPEGLADVIRQLATDRGRLHELGLSGRRYVEKYFTLQAFADRMRVAYADVGVRRPDTQTPRRGEKTAQRQGDKETGRQGEKKSVLSATGAKKC